MHIPNFVYLFICLSIHLLDNQVVCSFLANVLFLAWIMLLWTTVQKLLCEYFFISYEYLGVKLLDHMVTFCLAFFFFFGRMPILFPTLAEQFTFPSLVYGAPISLPPGEHLFCFEVQFQSATLGDLRFDYSVSPSLSFLYPQSGNNRLVL